ncbi:MAG TPA: acyl-CoA carboxylase subunit epsilon [Mycobacteriales bacterium]|nr:acyl-CoA carboxylase subunit epsilon [Mycobacteriales bacterium]
MTDDAKKPMLRVIAGGEPSDEELAALVAVLSARPAGAAPKPQPLRRPLPPWVASGLVKGTRTKA